MSNTFVSPLSARVNAGSLILNDYLLEVSDIPGGHRLTITRGSEVQTMDVMDGEGGGYAGQVQADWNQNSASQPDHILNRPFYGGLVGDTITWNGETQGCEIVELPMTSNGAATMIPCCRIADNPPSAQQMRSGNISVTLSDGAVITTNDTLHQISMVMDDGFAMLASLYIIVIPYNNYALVDGSDAIIFPKRGVYMTVLDRIYVSKLSIEGFEFGSVKQLDAVYLPGFAPVQSDAIEWNGEIADRDVALLMPGAPQFFVRVSDAVPGFEAMLQAGNLGVSFYSAESGVQAQDIPAEEIPEYVFRVSETAYVIGEYFAVVAMQDNASFSLGTIVVNLPKRGVYFMYVMDEASGAAAGYVSRVASAAIRHVSGAVLQEACIPEGIQRVGGDVILRSSTAGSSKQFLLRVDDGGAITAVEVSA